MVMQIENRKVAKLVVLKPDYPTAGSFPPQNEKFEDLKHSIKSHGMTVPVFINSSSVVINGHYRLWAAKALNMDEVPTVVVRNRDDIDKYWDERYLE